MQKRWPRGSEWRIWDLHLHSPGTKLNDQFSSRDGDVWDEYCRRLHESRVRVFGITDYFSAHGYFSARDNFIERYPDSCKLLLPNIELRTNDVVNQAQEEVNVHLIFNPSAPEFANRIRTFLQSLKTNKTDISDRHIKASELLHRKDFEEASTTRAFIQEAIEETYGKGADLLDTLLIATAVNNNGIRPARGRQRKLLITDELDKFSDVFFGNAGNTDYFLKTNRAQDESVLTEPKPVLSGCDAHSFSDLDTRLGKLVSDTATGFQLEPTWIKADPTFDGLKQIIFEPGDRVYIGTEPAVERRVRQHKTKYIESLRITSIKGYQGQHGSWFASEEILLGKELVAVIGNKGSGKSAVTDIIGLLGNSYNQTSRGPHGKKEELFSFLNREKFLRKGLAKNFIGELAWHDSDKDSKQLSSAVDQDAPERVEYLPQKYLERICANIEDDAFRTTLNEVIFRYVKPQNQFGQSNLDELIALLVSQSREEIQESQHGLHLANERVVSVVKKLTTDYQEKVKERVALKEKELAAHESNRPVEVPNPGDSEDSAASEEAARIEELNEEIESCSTQIQQLEKEQGECSQVLQALAQLKQAIEQKAAGLLGLKARHSIILDSLGLSFEQIVNLTVDYSKLDAPVLQKQERLDHIGDLLAPSEETDLEFAIDDEPAAAAVKESESIVCKKEDLERQRTQLLERQAMPEREYQKYQTELRNWTAQRNAIIGDDQDPASDTLKGLERELHRIESVYPSKLANARAEQERISKEIFQKKCGLKRFYEETKRSIDTEIAKCREDLGDYAISIEAGLRFEPSFVEEFLHFVNQNKRGTFNGIEEGKSVLFELCDEVDDWEDEAQVFSALANIVRALHEDKRENLPRGDNRTRDVFGQMINQQQPLVDLYDYLFGLDYLNTKYDLKVDQKDLSELSPGERGGLLLVFYLMLDKREIPLIIDQPEDNLDNKSVYEILVTFIKQAKKRRQIVLVTHNPNLAVVADAEQIIHVSIDKTLGTNEFDFFSGSIECPKVNRAVIDILEGTLPAFDNRRLKYMR